ncbi:hypothetical protein GCM10010207_85480 [Streptomyces atratus]|nr:hypothetical protein GCM10010207_85480 [Streptomyces atratus]
MEGFHQFEQSEAVHARIELQHGLPAGARLAWQLRDPDQSLGVTSAMSTLISPVLWWCPCE